MGGLSCPVTIVTTTCSHPLRYTSLGSTSDTTPNPALRQSTPATKGRSEDVADGHAHSINAGAYLPAYMLTDDTLERAGRN